jgi:iron complex transport system ATP-binding protein
VTRLQIDSVSVTLDRRMLLQPLSVDLDGGELVGLIGPNGAGKSTLVKAVAQLVPHAGGCRLDTRSLEAMSARERARRLAYLAQADESQWPITVRDLVALGRHPFRGSWWRGAGGPEADDDRAIDAALRATDVFALRTRRLDKLSGGERARARLARALAVEAPLLLVDEPVAALDPRHQLAGMAVLREQCDNGALVVVVLHDLTLASRFCDRLLLLDRGAVVAFGTPDEVLSPTNLRDVYGIQVVHGSHAGRPYIVPWNIDNTDTDEMT